MAETKKAKKDNDKPAAKPELKAVDRDVLPSADGLPAGDDAGGGEGGGFSKKKLAVFIMLPVLILIGAVAGAYYLGYIPKFGAKKVDCATVTEGDKDYAACAQEIAQ